MNIIITMEVFRKKVVPIKISRHLDDYIIRDLTDIVLDYIYYGTTLRVYLYPLKSKKESINK